MNPRRSLERKVFYVMAIIILLGPMYWLSRPAVPDPGGQFTGGKLAQLRKDYELSEGSLGTIDPASETVRLASLGMQGVAANILWGKAQACFVKKDWTNFAAALEQIAVLQPHFISVWVFQGWNLAYNTSVQFDEYHERYHWVIRGINYLKEGIELNSHEPSLHWYVGWVTSQKIGRSDEHVLFRRLFKDDNEFHGGRPRDRARQLAGGL